MDFITLENMPIIDAEVLQSMIEESISQIVSVEIGEDENGLMVSEIRNVETGEVIGEVGVFNGTE